MNEKLSFPLVQAREHINDIPWLFLLTNKKVYFVCCFISKQQQQPYSIKGDVYVMCPRFSLKLFLFCIHKVARIFFCSFILSLLFMFAKLLPLHFEMLSDECCCFPSCYLRNIKKVDEGRRNYYVAFFNVKIQT